MTTRFKNLCIVLSALAVLGQVRCGGNGEEEAPGDTITQEGCSETAQPDAAGDVMTDVCKPSCAEKECGGDGCGGNCGLCRGDFVCNDGTCGPECIPDCQYKDCGEDGCGGKCGSCPMPLVCIDYVCACVALCGGKECGTDLCGGSCGECQEPFVCDWGKCECEFGACKEGDELAETCGGKSLGNCEAWACQDGCCDTQEIPPPDCCQTTEDCRDCINLETKETAPCPFEIPESFVENKCTKDVCGFGSKCKHFDKAAFGECSDEDDCTIDTCDFATGLCVHTPVTDNPECPK